MKLLHSSVSPFVRKVMVLLHETGLIDRVTFAPGTTSPLSPNPLVADANPVGKIPTLILDDGRALHDSRVITRYLDTLHGGAPLYPEGDRLWSVLTLESIGDGMNEAALAIVYEGRLRGEAERSQPWIDAQTAKIDGAMAALESSDAGRLAGPLNMGQVAVACALGYVDFRLNFDWRDRHPALAAWHEAFALRASSFGPRRAPSSQAS